MVGFGRKPGPVEVNPYITGKFVGPVSTRVSGLVESGVFVLPKRILDLGSAGGEVAERILEIPVNHEFTCVEGHYPSYMAGIDRLAKFGSRAKSHHLDLSASNAIEGLSNIVGAPRRWCYYSVFFTMSKK